MIDSQQASISNSRLQFTGCAVAHKTEDHGVWVRVLGIDGVVNTVQNAGGIEYLYLAMTIYLVSLDFQG